MRPIDAIGLKQALVVSAILEDKKTIEQIIDEQPTIEPERKTGRWIPDNTDYYRTRFICSACGESEEVPTTGFGYGPMWNYCPMCGAKMEDERKE